MFCENMNYPDGSHVTEEKLYQFLNEEVLTQPLSRVRDPDNNTPSYNYARQYVSAIRELWQHQKAEGMVSRTAPEPNGPSVKALMKSLMQRNPPPRRFVYTEWELLTFLGQFKVRPEQFGHIWRTRIGPDKRLRTMTDFIISRKMMVSGNCTRMATLSDIFAVELPNEGSSPSYALVLGLLNGETNKTGMYEYGAAMRNADVMCCPFAILGMYFFHRYQILDEEPPNFATDQYQSVRLLRTRNSNTRVLPQQMQFEEIALDFPEADLSDYKKSFFGRGPGARETNLSAVFSRNSTDAAGNEEDQITSLIRTLPKIMMRAQAGFDINACSYSIRRDMHDPPAELTSQIFPFVDRWLPNDANANPDLSSSAIRVLKLFRLLRKFVLQDAVILRRKYPSNPVFQHDIFKSDSYKSYEFILGHMCDRLDDLEELKDLRRSYQSLEGTLSSLVADVHRQTDEINNTLKELKNKFPEELAGAFGENDIPIYSFCRSHTTVQELWDEWTLGIDGKPSVESLEQRYGSKWRRTTSDRQFFSRRNAIIKEVKRIAMQEYNGDFRIAIEKLDVIRMQQPSKTLHSLAAMLLYQTRGERELEKLTARNRRAAERQRNATGSSVVDKVTVETQTCDDGNSARERPSELDYSSDIISSEAVQIYDAQY